jgi:hypothetical protein
MSLVTDQSPGPFLIRECLDSPKRAESCRKALDIPSIEAIRLGMKAIADWSPERRFLGPFREVFGA